MNKILFQKRLREVRIRRGYATQLSLAKAYNKKFNPCALNTSGILGSIKKWESGKSIPTIEKLDNLCELLSCDVNYLLGKIDCTNYKSTEFKQETGLCEITYDRLKELYKLKKEQKLVNPNMTTELDILESIINQHNGNILNCMWYRIIRSLQYPTQELETIDIAGLGNWKIKPDDLKRSDDMVLYNSLIKWIEEYYMIHEEIISGDM